MNRLSHTFLAFIGLLLSINACIWKSDSVPPPLEFDSWPTHERAILDEEFSSEICGSVLRLKDAQYFDEEGKLCGESALDNVLDSVDVMLMFKPWGGRWHYYSFGKDGRTTECGEAYYQHLDWGCHRRKLTFPLPIKCQYCFIHDYAEVDGTMVLSLMEKIGEQLYLLKYEQLSDEETEEIIMTHDYSAYLEHTDGGAGFMNDEWEVKSIISIIKTGSQTDIRNQESLYDMFSVGKTVMFSEDPATMIIGDSEGNQQQTPCSYITDKSGRERHIEFEGHRFLFSTGNREMRMYEKLQKEYNGGTLENVILLTCGTSTP